jgi:hypothetical protein
VCSVYTPQLYGRKSFLKNHVLLMRPIQLYGVSLHPLPRAEPGSKIQEARQKTIKMVEYLLSIQAPTVKPWEIINEVISKMVSTI